jgi:hypothetical protein
MFMIKNIIINSLQSLNEFNSREPLFPFLTKVFPPCTKNEILPVSNPAGNINFPEQNEVSDCIPSMINHFIYNSPA